LFSATVAALILPWIISWTSSDPSNDTQLEAPSDDTQNTQFLEIANLLWFFSLLISIFCALHALTAQRLAKPSTWVTSLRHSQPEQARMVAYFAIEIERANKTVRILHYVMVVSLLIFFSGLLLYFKYLDPNFFMVAESLVFIYFSLRITRKIVIYFRPDSPDCTPFTQEKTNGRIRFTQLITKGRRRFTQENIKERRSRFDGEVLKRTLDMSMSDDDLEQFFEAIPGFCASKIVDDPSRSLDVLGLPGLAEALIGFWNRTLSSNRVSESVKVRRLVVCVRVIEATDLSIAVPHILHLLSGDLSEVSRSVEIGHSLRPLRNGNAALLVRGIIASIISDAERNDRWFTLSMDELGISRDVLRGYIGHGNSVLLANLIHISRHFFHGLLQPNPDLTREALSILPSVSKFDILNTLPELQHDFCALWNDVVRQVQSSGAKNNPFMEILLDIQGLYISLHGNCDPLRPPASYPLCEDDSHRNLTTQVQWVGGFASGEANHPTATIFPIPPPVVTWQCP
jgi:hypothetical protein